MNYTEKYHLPQWKKEDRIMMDDFNAAMAGIERGMSGNAQAAAKAQAKADAAYSPGQKPYVTGSYRGTGHALTVNLGFRPSFLIITAVEGFPLNTPGRAVAYCGQTGGNTMSSYITLTDAGFQIIEPGQAYPNLSADSRTYDYIAFR